MKEHKCKLDLVDEIFTVDKQEYELLPGQFETNIDNLLAQKNHLKGISEKEGIEKDIKGLIKNMRTRKPDLGTIPLEKHEFNLYSEPPINKKQYPVPLAIKENAINFLKDLQEKGIITKKSSSYSSPAIFIRKKNIDLRLVVDYRTINKVTTKKHFPIPKIQEHLSQLAGAKMFS